MQTNSFHDDTCTFQEARRAFCAALDSYVQATNELTQATKDFVGNAQVMTDACDEMEHTLKVI